MSNHIDVPTSQPFFASSETPATVPLTDYHTQLVSSLLSLDPILAPVNRHELVEDTPDGLFWKKSVANNLINQDLVNLISIIENRMSILKLGEKY